MAASQRCKASSLYPAAVTEFTLPFNIGDLEGKCLQLALLDIFLTTPTRNLEIMRSLHEMIYLSDPYFYRRLACWFIRTGISMDHKEIFLANLLTSPWKEHRRLGAHLVDSFPVNELSRVVDYCKRVTRKFPRIARTVVRNYIRRLETDTRRFDSVVLGGRKYMKHLYASLRIRPSGRAQRILFEKSPPPDSVLSDLKELLGEREPEKQAELIIHCGLPLSIALRYVRNMTSALVVRLLETMAPAEILRNLNVLRNSGVLKDEEVKRLLEEKVAVPGGEKKTGTARYRIVSRPPLHPGAHPVEIGSIIEECRARSISIERPTAVLIDKSGSMETAIELGKILAMLISALALSDFFVYLFDSEASALKPERNDPEEWERLFAPIRAGGSTSPGSALRLMSREGERVEQIILITDGNENSEPDFLEAMAEYQQKLHGTPYIMVIKTGHFSSRFEKKLSIGAICATMLPGEPDRFMLARLMLLLSAPCKEEIYREIITAPLPDDGAPGAHQ